MIEALAHDDSATWSPDEREYARSILSLAVPSNKVRDQALAATPQDYPYCYYSRSHPLQAGMLHIESIGEHTIEGINRRWLYTTQLLTLVQLYSLELTPIDARSIAFILLPYDRIRYPHKRDNTIALVSREQSTHQVLITQAQGGWQMKYLDKKGIVVVNHRTTRDQALFDAIRAHYTITTPTIHRS